MNYPFNTIIVNGREVSIEALARGQFNHRSAFEKEAYEFIKQWLNETEVFTFNTSGSTGLPHTISATRAQLCFSAQLSIEALDLKPGESVLACLPSAFIATRMMIVRAFEGGLRLILQEPSINPIREVNAQIDLVALVPLQVLNLLSTKDSGLKHCK